MAIHLNICNFLAGHANTIQELSPGNAGTCKSYYFISPALSFLVNKCLALFLEIRQLLYVVVSVIVLEFVSY